MPRKTQAGVCEKDAYGIHLLFCFGLISRTGKVPYLPAGPLFLSDIGFVVVFPAGAENEFLPGREVVAEERVEHLRRRRGVGGGDTDEPSCGGVHGGFGHHLRLVFAETLGALQIVLLIAEGFQDLLLFLLVICEIGVLLVVISYSGDSAI